MNKKYLMKGMAALALLAGFSSCVKDVDGSSSGINEEQKAKENAELQLGFMIPDGQTWDMASQVEANVTVNLTDGESYYVAVYSNNPVIDGKGVVLANATVKNGGTFSESFTCGNDCDKLYVGVTDKNNYTIYKAVKVENGRISTNISESSASASRSMRSITVNGDVYNKFPSVTDVAAKFPTRIPDDADDLPTNGDYNYYYGNGAGHNYVIRSAGTYTIGGGWQNTGYDAELDRWGVPQPYNVYVFVDGNDEVLIKHSGSAMHNLYILKGNVKLDSSVGEMANVVITVANGATLTDTRDHIAARTDLYGAVELYNKGTFNATNSLKYDMGNKARFYNEGTATITGALSYSPADAENSFFINFGDQAELTAPSMILNSTGNFFNSGTTTITGETKVTQTGIYWVNNGKYTTGSMIFSAKNATFYNYCQLIVTGNAHMYDGEFNLMADSYTECNTAEFDNFIVNMANNSGLKVIGDTNWGPQGDGTYQGVKATGSKAFVYFGGTTTVAGHMRSMEFSGNVTFAHSNIVDLGAGISGVQPTIVLTNEGVKEVTIADVTFTAPSENECSGTWNKGGTPKNETLQVYTYAFEDQTLNTDYDLNDVVLKVNYHVTETNEETGEVVYDKTQLDVQLVAAGATYEIKAKIGDDYLFDGQEIHQAMGQNKGVMINTGGTGSNSVNGVPPAEWTVAVPAGWNGEFEELPVSIEVSTTNKTYAFPNDDIYPHVVMIPVDWAWPIERVNIKDAYPGTADAETITNTYTATYTNKETNELVEGEFTMEFKENSFAAWATSVAADRVGNGWYNCPLAGKVITSSAQ